MPQPSTGMPQRASSLDPRRRQQASNRSPRKQVAAHVDPCSTLASVRVEHAPTLVRDAAYRQAESLGAAPAGEGQRQYDAIRHADWRYGYQLTAYASGRLRRDLQAA